MNMELWKLVALGGIALVTGTNPADANKEKVIHSFTGVEGYNPSGAVSVDNSGNLYGTTEFAGEGNCCGTVFKLSPDGTFRVLYTFTGAGDGGYPTDGVVADDVGNIYGTTPQGGDSDCSCGTVFKLNRKGKETTLHTFMGGGNDGASPLGKLARDPAGNLYGTTIQGGANCDGTFRGCGTVYRITPRGDFGVIYTFIGSNDGLGSEAGVIFDSSENLYGSTFQGGGSANCFDGCGTVFKLSSKTGKEKILHAFSGGIEGSGPGPVVLDSRGNLIGTTADGGDACEFDQGCGVVFRLTQKGKLKILHAFADAEDGYGPQGVIVDLADNAYGAAIGGGVGGGGIVFRVSPRGKMAVLHAFSGAPDGLSPEGELLMDNVGLLYGTTSAGGDDNFGTVFEIKN